MSWGERSCQHIRDEEFHCECTELTCNVSCEHYTWDGIASPDTIPNHGIQNMLDLIDASPFSEKKTKRMLRKIME